MCRFEDGVKAKLGHELSDLREKQNNIGQSLEDVMDKVEKSKEEDERLGTCFYCLHCNFCVQIAQFRSRQFCQNPVDSSSEKIFRRN